MKADPHVLLFSQSLKLFLYFSILAGGKWTFLKSNPKDIMSPFTLILFLDPLK